MSFFLFFNNRLVFFVKKAYMKVEGESTDNGIGINSIKSLTG